MPPCGQTRSGFGIGAARGISTEISFPVTSTGAVSFKSTGTGCDAGIRAPRPLMVWTSRPRRLAFIRFPFQPSAGAAPETRGGALMLLAENYVQLFPTLIQFHGQQPKFKQFIQILVRRKAQKRHLHVFFLVALVIYPAAKPLLQELRVKFPDLLNEFLGLDF